MADQRRQFVEPPGLAWTGLDIPTGLFGFVEPASRPPVVFVCLSAGGSQHQTDRCARTKELRNPQVTLITDKLLISLKIQKVA